MNMTADAPLLAADGVPLAVKLKRAERRKKLRAALLVAPLAVFLLATFILPIALLLYRSVENPEVPAMLPKTVSALAGWQGQGLPDEAVLVCLPRSSPPPKTIKPWSATPPSA